MWNSRDDDDDEYAEDYYLKEEEDYNDSLDDNGLAIKEENDDDNDSEAETALLSHVHYAPLKIIAAAIEASVNTSEVTSTSVSTGVKREEQPLLHNDVATSLDMNDDTKVKSDEDIVSEKSEDSDEDTKYTIATPTTIKKEESDDDDDSRYSMTTSSTTRKINATNYLDKIKVEKKESDIMDNKSDSDSESDNEDNHETTLTTNISTPTTNEDNITESSDYASMTVALPSMNEATSLLQVIHLVQTQVDSNESEDTEQNSNFDHLNDKAFSVIPRYFQEKGQETRTCQLCNKVGHLRRDCPQNKPQCSICGEYDHLARECKFNGVVCFRCNEPGHVSRDCRASMEQIRRRCERCGSSNHKTTTCPTFWRSYKYVKVNSSSTKMPKVIYCYNCGDQGHFGDNCDLPRPRRTRVESSAFNYHLPSPDHKRARTDTHRRAYSSKSSSSNTPAASRSSRRYGASSTTTHQHQQHQHHHIPSTNNDRMGGYIGGSANRRAMAFNNPVPPPWHPASRLNPHSYAANPNWALHQQQQQQQQQYQQYQQQQYQQYQRSYQNDRNNYYR